MSELVINNRLIETPIYNILKDVQSSLHNGKLGNISNKSDYVMISCPYHKGGLEQHPSCTVYADPYGNKTQYGTAHCFTCGYTASLPQLIGDCFDRDANFGARWLLENYGDTYYSSIPELKEIKLTPDKPDVTEELDESILNAYDFYHPYMWQRKLTKEVVDKFRVGFDKTRQAITFPVYDENHKLVMVTARSVLTKQFFITENANKPVYLLYDILERNIDKVYVCESQLNTLTMRTWGYDSVGLFGTGSQHQYDILKKSGIRKFILCLDGDEAGRKGANRFRKAMEPCGAVIQTVILPEGRDINDISKNEFEILLEKSNNSLF